VGNLVDDKIGCFGGIVEILGKMLRNTKKKIANFRIGSGVLRVVRRLKGKPSDCRALGPLEWARMETSRADPGEL